VPKQTDLRFTKSEIDPSESIIFESKPISPTMEASPASFVMKDKNEVTFEFEGDLTQMKVPAIDETFQVVDRSSLASVSGDDNILGKQEPSKVIADSGPEIPGGLNLMADLNQTQVLRSLQDRVEADDFDFD